MRKWYNVELSQRKAELFVEQLEKVEFGDGFSYEVSGIGELRHFELYLERIVLLLFFISIFDNFCSNLYILTSFDIYYSFPYFFSNACS